MNEQEKIIYNEGERLIPGVSHDDREKQRHFASYSFFKELIAKDSMEKGKDPIVLDLGCGVGYGCNILATLPKSQVIGIDNSKEVIAYAMEKYPAQNIGFMVQDICAFIDEGSFYPYVVSRGVFEHIEEGLEWLAKVNYKEMFIFDVPYDEKPGNKHHKVLGITETSLAGLGKIEFYYEDLDGKITKEKPAKPNMVVSICRK